MMAATGCCCGNVLFWNTNVFQIVGLAKLRKVYEDMGLTVHTNTNWSGNIHDYKLIIWVMALSDPPWAGTVFIGLWEGRLVFTCEHSNGFKPTIDYVNEQTLFTGLTALPASIDTNCSHAGTTEGNELTQGMAAVQYALTAQISGGNIVSKTKLPGSVPWLCRNKPAKNDANFGLTDYVLAGDSNWIDDICGDAVHNVNKKLFEALWNVPI